MASTATFEYGPTVVSQGGVFRFFLENELLVPSWCLNPKGSKKNEFSYIWSHKVLFWGAKIAWLCGFQGKSGPLPKSSITSQDFEIAPFLALKSQKIDQMP